MVMGQKTAIRRFFDYISRASVFYLVVTKATLTRPQLQTQQASPLLDQLLWFVRQLL